MSLDPCRVPVRLTLVISSLGMGGAERAASRLAGAWAEQGHDVVLVTLSSDASDFFSVDPRVKRLSLDLLRPSRHLLTAAVYNARRAWVLRHAIVRSKPDVVISFVDEMNVLVLVAAVGTGLPVVATEQIDPRHRPMRRTWSFLRRLTYPRASALVMLTESVRAWAEALVPAERVHVIPNPAVPDEVHSPGAASPRDPVVVGLGRLVHQKGFDSLLRAFAAVADRHPDWSLIVIGEGPERASLEALVTELDLASRVRLPGACVDPSPILQSASVFALSSRYEGFGVALVEAMASGMAVVSFACPSGPDEIVRDGVDGLLVPAGDEQQFVAALDRLLSDERLRRMLGKGAQNVTERLSLPAILDRWEPVLRQAAVRRR